VRTRASPPSPVLQVDRQALARRSRSYISLLLRQERLPPQSTTRGVCCLEGTFYDVEGFALRKAFDISHPLPFLRLTELRQKGEEGGIRVVTRETTEGSGEKSYLALSCDVSTTIPETSSFLARGDWREGCFEKISKSELQERGREGDWL